MRIPPPLRGLANTLTLILDADRNVFGGFSLGEWDSHVWNGKTGNENNCIKGDDSGWGVFSR
jgi:hypothetical protein